MPLGYQVFAGVRREQDAQALRKAASAHLFPIIMDVRDKTAIAEAAALVAGGYTLPLDPVPTILKSIAYALISYALHKRKLKLKIPESLEKDYEKQMKLLQKIATKELRIEVSAAPSTLKLYEI